MNLFFVVDEYTDVGSASAVREIVEVVIDALHNPDIPRPKGEILLGELTRQSVLTFLRISSSTTYIAALAGSGLAEGRPQHPLLPSTLLRHLRTT